MDGQLQDCLRMFWCWLRDGESGSTTIRNLGLVIAATIALPLAIWRSVVAAHQADAARKQSETAQRGLLNERYQKGSEMLGSNVLAVRLGGIYALARLASEHPRDYHMQIVSLLCAFVRHPPVVETDNQDTNKLREDVQAVMTAVGKRSKTQIRIETKRGYSINLIKAVLTDAVLIGANLTGAALVEANLTEAMLAEANLTGAVLDRANLTGAMLYKANLTGADLRRCTGLTQRRLDQALTIGDDPPDLTNVVDANTEDPIVWRGEPLIRTEIRSRK